MSRSYCSRRPFPLLGVGLLLFVGAAPVAAQLGGRRAKIRTRPNILILVADDVGWRDIDASVPTPNIDAFAARGVTFRRAYASAVCSPTRFQLLFGTQNFREDLGSFIQICAPGDTSVSLAHKSLARVMRNQGYDTLATGKWHLNTITIGELYEAPRMFGFRHYHSGWVGNLGGKGGDYFDWLRIDDGSYAMTTEYNTTSIARATAEWWEATPGSKFAYVAFQAPHAPYHAAPAELLPPGHVVGSDTRSQFESMIMAMDTEIGNLLSVVDFRDTIVFFISDNGTPGAAAAPDQVPGKLKTSVYEGGIRVPVMVAGWGVPGNREAHGLISTVDLYATVLELIGAKVPAGHAIDSVSFARQIKSPSRPGRDWVYAHIFAPNGPGPKTFNTKAVITETHKLWRHGLNEKLFDLVNDPDEENPLDIPLNQALYDTLNAHMLDMEAQGAP